MNFNERMTFIAFVFSLMVIFLVYPKSVSSEALNEYNITIDGNFDDWADKPKTDIFFDYNNGNVTKQGAFLSDGTFLYIYLDMDPYDKGHNYRFQGSGWTVQIGNNTTSLSFSVDGGIWSLQPGAKASISSVWAWSNNNPDQLFINQQLTDATGFVVTEKTSNGWAYRDRAEIRIPLADFINNPDIVQSMTVFDTDNMGQQKITITGADTGSNLIILSGFGLASVVVFRKVNQNRKKRLLS